MKLYSSIKDLPVGLFDDINRTGNYKLLLKSGILPPKYNLEKRWLRIYDEFINEFGLSDQFKEWVRLKREWAKLCVDVHLKDQAFKSSILELKSRLIQEKEKEMRGGSSLGEIASAMGVEVDIYKMTTFVFYHNLKRMQKNGKESD